MKTGDSCAFVMKSITGSKLAFILALIAAFFAIGCGEEEEPEVLQRKRTGQLTYIITNASTGEAIEGAQVRVVGISIESTDANGTVIFSNLSLDKHDIRVTAAGYIETSQTVRVREEGITVKLSLIPGVKVIVSVVSDVGNPVAYVKVTLRSPEIGDHSSFTNSLGNCILSPILPSRYSIIAEKPGYKTEPLEGAQVGKEEIGFNISLTREVSGKILFEKGLYNKASFGISIVNADRTGGINELTSSLDRFPNWSPDGNKIVFQGKGQDRESGPWKIYTMDKYGGGIVNISGEAENDIMPAWSSDGRKIAFVHWDILSEPAIYVMNTDGTNRIEIAKCAKEGRPTWSPDSSMIAFVKGGEVGLDIYVVNADGTNENRLPSFLEDEIAPDWSPSGDKLTYTVVSSPREADVYVTDVYLGGENKISSGPGFNGPSCWSPDGNKIIFSSNRGGQFFGIYMVDADGSNETLISYNAGVDQLVNQNCWTE